MKNVITLLCILSIQSVIASDRQDLPFNFIYFSDDNKPLMVSPKCKRIEDENRAICTLFHQSILQLNANEEKQEIEARWEKLKSEVVSESDVEDVFNHLCGLADPGYSESLKNEAEYYDSIELYETLTETSIRACNIRTRESSYDLARAYIEYQTGIERHNCQISNYETEDLKFNWSDDSNAWITYGFSGKHGCVGRQTYVFEELDDMTWTLRETKTYTGGPQCTKLSEENTYTSGLERYYPNNCKSVSFYNY